MTTLNEQIKALKLKYPTLTKGINDEVFELDADEYLATITEWAQNMLNQEIANDAEAAKATAKATAEGKLAALGLTTDDLRALGL